MQLTFPNNHWYLKSREAYWYIHILQQTHRTIFQALSAAFELTIDNNPFYGLFYWHQYLKILSTVWVFFNCPWLFQIFCYSSCSSYRIFSQSIFETAISQSQRVSKIASFSITYFNCFKLCTSLQMSSTRASNTSIFLWACATGLFVQHSWNL